MFLLCWWLKLPKKSPISMTFLSEVVALKPHQAFPEAPKGLLVTVGQLLMFRARKSAWTLSIHHALRRLTLWQLSGSFWNGIADSWSIRDRPVTLVSSL